MFTQHELRAFDRGSRQVAVRGYGWIIVTILVVAALSGIGWGLKVALSDVKGQGDAIVHKNSASNRIAAQEKFETLYQGIVAADQRITVAAAEKNAAPTDDAARIRYYGAIQFCQGLVADYNAAARHFTSADFRAVDLPAQVSDLDLTTDCKE